eukprot:2305609-Pleurochrysis_carterae.AAC.7
MGQRLVRRARLEDSPHSHSAVVCKAWVNAAGKYSGQVQQRRHLRREIELAPQLGNLGARAHAVVNTARLVGLVHAQLRAERLDGGGGQRSGGGVGARVGAGGGRGSFGGIGAEPAANGGELR